MKRLFLILALLGISGVAMADTLTWSTPYGTIGLPVTATESLVGYDVLEKQAIAGLSLPVYTSPKNILVLEIGAVGAWPTAGAVVQPYISMGHDILPEISQMTGIPVPTAAHLNVFARYDSTTGKAGVGPSFSYSF